MNPFNIYIAQCKAMRKYSVSDDKPAGVSFSWIVFTYLIPVACGILVFFCSPNDDSGDQFLAALGILAGALIAAFSQLAAWRDRLQSSMAHDEAHRPDRWLIDASAAHLLAGAYSSIVASILVIIRKAVTLPVSWFPWTHRIGMSLVVVVGAHAVTSLMSALPRMYSAYTAMNDVSKLLDGDDF